MLRISHRAIAVSAATLSLLAVGCSDSSSPLANATVSMQDQCDPATFNAALGAGACSRQGTETLAAFNAELAASQHVAAWQFTPATLTIRTGQTITATNNGGETHTFTQVAQFGGGMVASLNTAAGNLVETPECKALATNALVASGGTFTTSPTTTTGTVNYQCCIHPWMRATVTVSG